MGKKYIFWDIDKTLLCLSGVTDTLSSDQQKNLSSDTTSVKVGWNDRLKTEIHASFQALYIEEHKRFFISILELCKKGKAEVRILTASIYPEIEILFELNNKFLTKPVLDLSQKPYINRNSLGGAFNIMSTVDDLLVGDNKFFSSQNEIFGMERDGCTIENSSYHLLFTHKPIGYDTRKHYPDRYYSD
ncbi:hypothetical protein [Pelagibaculum spongiae]|uniref:Uncharacterized protein n=1 Tax=Pelagibaculum spongiae TaxID=2080658 RepID=A0A2V1GVZ2_9GAMM|nr:hypothetical protein [Pelagibaculum spongiae]PVZ70498.1 hypothetical protein DC094_07910 [Pelagibaculum spongiae]